MSLVAVTDADFGGLELERELLHDAGHALVATEDAVDPTQVAGLLNQWVQIDANELDRWPALEVIGRFGLGTDNIDVDEARRRGVRVVNSGAYSTDEVASHAVALLLAVVRQIVRGDRGIRNGEWLAPIRGESMARVGDLRVGVVGLGRIGRRVAAILSDGFGCDVLGYDPVASGHGVTTVADLPELLGEVDVVSLHAPLTEATQGLISAAELAAMRPGAVLINVARGGLVDQDALVDALRDGHLSGAGLDVLLDEPLPPDHPLRELDQVVLTPHIGYLSPAALLQARRQTVADLIAVLAGSEPTHTL